MRKRLAKAISMEKQAASVGKLIAIDDNLSFLNSHSFLSKFSFVLLILFPRLTLFA
jgi:hypothetical protein